MLNFEHSAERPGQFKGTAAILQKLQSLPFQQARGSHSFVGPSTMQFYFHSSGSLSPSLRLCIRMRVCDDTLHTQALNARRKKRMKRKRE